MSVAWSRYIRENFRNWDLSPCARALIEAIGHYGNAEGCAWPSTAELVERTGLSPATVKRARREIRAAGALVIIDGRGRGRATIYELPATAIKGVSGDPFSDAKRGHLEREKGSPGARKGVTGDPPSTNRSTKGSARVAWCDETCRLCDGTGFVSELRTVNGKEGSWAQPCPNRSG